MSRTWIHYNEPEVPSVMHAGVLLGLGLHGHLRVLTISDVYRYLTQVRTFSEILFCLFLESLVCINIFNLS